MKTFVASLLVASAYAQTTNSTTTDKAVAAVKNAADTVANTFKGLVADYLQAKTNS